MKKCTLCIDRIYNENLVPEDRTPACVMVCPVNARHFGDLGDAGSEVSEMVARRSGGDLMPELGYKPVNKYLPPRAARMRRPAGCRRGSCRRSIRPPPAIACCGGSTGCCPADQGGLRRPACIPRCRLSSSPRLRVPVSLCCCCSGSLYRSVSCRSARASALPRSRSRSCLPPAGSPLPCFTSAGPSGPGAPSRNGAHPGCPARASFPS